MSILASSEGVYLNSIMNRKHKSSAHIANSVTAMVKKRSCTEARHPDILVGTCITFSLHTRSSWQMTSSTGKPNLRNDTFHQNTTTPAICNQNNSVMHHNLSVISKRRTLKPTETFSGYTGTAVAITQRNRSSRMIVRHLAIKCLRDLAMPI